MLQQGRAATVARPVGVDVELVIPVSRQDEERHKLAALLHDPRAALRDHLGFEPGQHLVGVVDGSRVWPGWIATRLRTQRAASSPASGRSARRMAR